MHTVVLTIIQVQALIKLKCLSESDSSDEDYKKATGFILKEGIDEYDPICQRWRLQLSKMEAPIIKDGGFKYGGFKLSII